MIGNPRFLRLSLESMHLWNFLSSLIITFELSKLVRPAKDGSRLTFRAGRTTLVSLEKGKE